MDTKRWTSAGLFCWIPGPINVSDMNLKSSKQITLLRFISPFNWLHSFVMWVAIAPASSVEVEYVKRKTDNQAKIEKCCSSGRPIARDVQ